MDYLSEKSGCDWDFLVDMYNHINRDHGDVDWDQFEIGVMNHDWSVRGDKRFEDVLMKLSEDSGYEYDYLFALYTDMIYDPNDDGGWEYFKAVTMERDW
jgi:hypothetical protein